MKRNRIFRLSLLCLVLVVATKTFAQQIESERDKIFEHVDLPQVPYGILENYGLSSVSLLPYTKQELDTTNYLNYATLQQIIGGLNSSMVIPHRPDSINLDRVNSLNEEYYGKGVVPITLLRYDLCRFSEEAVRRGDVYPLNDQIRVKGGISKSPYEELHLFAAAPFTSELASRDVTFCIPQQLMLTNSQAIAQIEVQFEEGQPFRSIAIGEQVSYRYATDGLKMVTMRIQQVGASRWYSSHFPLAITTPQETKIVFEFPELESVFFLSESGIHSGGTLQYKLSPHNHTGKFRKPLFIVEGFEVYPTITSDTAINHTLLDVFYDEDDLNRILDLGYDIAYLDYADGMDDIRRNAALFQEALRYINTHKEGDEKNVVVGLSMGGLVASYGLRKMELAGEDHETRKYISYDSPHMGANVPLGAFYMAYHWLKGSEFSKIRRISNIYLWYKKTPVRMSKIREWLRKPAIKQLVPFYTEDYLFFLKRRDPGMKSFTNPYDNVYDVPLSPNPEFASFHKEYNQMGLPRKTFNVAFSNGAIGASPIVPRGSHLAEAGGYVYGLFGLSSGFFASLFNNRGTYLNHFPLTSSTFTVEAYVNAMPCRNPYYQDIALTKHYLFGLLPYTYHLSRMQVRVQNPNPLFNDVDAGGIYTISSQYTNNPLVDWTVVDPEKHKFWSWFLSSKFSAKVNTSKFCFVPLNSSLGIPAGEKITSYEEAKRKSPFDFVYTVSGESSEEHISFWSHFNDFLLALKEDIPKNYRPQLDSTATICDCGTTLKVLNPLEGFTYEWHTSLMLDIPSRTQGNGIQATLYPSEIAKKYSPFGKIGFVYVEAFLNGRKFVSSDSCYVYIGTPTTKEVQITQLEAKNSYNSKYLPYPTVQIDWPYWGNITGVEWGKQDPTNNLVIDGSIIDYDLVKQPLDQIQYESVTEPAMIRYDQQSNIYLAPLNSNSNFSQDLIGPDGKPIEKYEIPDYINEQSLIPRRTLQLHYEPSRTLFEKPGRYTLTYRLKNECGESESSTFTYQYLDVLDNVMITPSVVTTEDAVLRYDWASHRRKGSQQDHLVQQEIEYTYGIWSATGVLQRMGGVKLGDPLGVIDLPYGQYLVKVWYYDAYKEFHIMRQ